MGPVLVRGSQPARDPRRPGHPRHDGGAWTSTPLVGGGVTGHHGVLAALEAILDAIDSPDLPDLPPLHAGLVGYLGYDVVREVEHLPDAPPTTSDNPTRCCA